MKVLPPVHTEHHVHGRRQASNGMTGYAMGLNMDRLETTNPRQHIKEGVFGLRCIVIGLQADPETVACTEEARQA